MQHDQPRWALSLSFLMLLSLPVDRIGGSCETISMVGEVGHREIQRAEKMNVCQMGGAWKVGGAV